jgi:ParB family chromosome partitioning protein
VSVVPQQEPANVPDVISDRSVTEGVAFLPLKDLKPNPTQPRTHFSEQEVVELSESIKALGVLQPILVRLYNGEYQIVAGERRYRAATRAGLEQVPVIIKEIDDRQTLEIALVENVQRQNLNPLEEAKGYQRLMDEFSLSAQEVAERVGKERATVANIVRILRLPVGVQEMVADGRITVGHAKAILTVKEPSAQTNLANKVIAESLSVRALEAIVSRVVVFDSAKKSSDEKDVKKPRESAVYPELEERLRNAVGTKVSIHRTKQGGSIELHFFSDAELDRLVEILSASRE